MGALVMGMFSEEAKVAVFGKQIAVSASMGLTGKMTVKLYIDGSLVDSASGLTFSKGAAVARGRIEHDGRVYVVEVYPTETLIGAFWGQHYVIAVDGHVLAKTG